MAGTGPKRSMQESDHPWHLKQAARTWRMGCPRLLGASAGSVTRYRSKMIVTASQGPQMEALVAPISKNTAAPQIALEEGRCAVAAGHTTISFCSLHSGIWLHQSDNLNLSLLRRFCGGRFTTFAHRNLARPLMETRRTSYGRISQGRRRTKL